uniref:Uncharacterized protein n=1 Tax=Oryza punctata TaxID=4537 RepID=A0A0E0LTL6_ORYPU
MTDLVAVSAPICSSPPFLYQNRRPVITQSGCGLARPWSHRRSTLSPRRTPPAAAHAFSPHARSVILFSSHSTWETRLYKMQKQEDDEHK